jgi:hypothetical protein
MNIYFVKNVAAYAVLPEDDMWYVETCRSYESTQVS